MEKNQNDVILGIAVKTARIETHLEHQKATLDKIEKALESLEPVKKDVHRHGIIIKAFTWFFGILISGVTALGIRGL